MTDQIAATPVDVDAALSEVSAEVDWTVGTRPPQVVLSFQGLHEPTALWDALRAIGWTVPSMPPRPANAIDWTPDPVAGTDFTVLPWTVQEFRLEEGAWTVDEEHVGNRTLDALLDSHAEIIGSSSQITAHAAEYEHGKLARQAASTNPVQVPVAGSPPDDETAPHLTAPKAPAAQAPAVSIPVETTAAPDADGGYRTIILLGFPVDSDPLPGAGTWIGTSGRQRTRTLWSEYCMGADQAIPGHQDMPAQVAAGAAAWYADTDTPLAETAPAGQRIVRLVLPDMGENDAKVRRLNKVLGADIATHQLRSLVGANDSAVLVSATVAANSFTMLQSNLSLRMPNAIIRIGA